MNRLNRTRLSNAMLGLLGIGLAVAVYAGGAAVSAVAVTLLFVIGVASMIVGWRRRRGQR